MHIFHSHPWDVSLEEAQRIQERLERYIITEDQFQKIRVVAGVGISFGPSNLAVSIVRFTFPDLERLDFVSSKFPLSFPYPRTFLLFPADL